MNNPKNEDGFMRSVANLAERLVRETMIERGVKKPDARAIVAREARMKPGTLENLARGRLVNVDTVRGRINAYMVSRIERKIRQLESELAIARRACVDGMEIDVAAAQAALEEAKRLIRK
jgi:hypothetical protein